MLGLFIESSDRNVPDYYYANLGSTNNSFIVSLENQLLYDHQRDRTH